MTRKFKVNNRERCPICGSDAFVIRFIAYDDRYGLEDLYNIAECTNCKSYFIADAIMPELIPELYFQFYPKITISQGNQRLSAPYILRDKFIFFYQVIGFFLQGSFDLGIYVRKSEKVLDVGCGSGKSAFIVKQKGGDWTGLEIDPKRCDAIKKTGLNCINGSIEEIRTNYKEKFDVVLASQVIEHTFDPQVFMESCSMVLRSGGRLILSTPNSNSRYRHTFKENWIHWHVPYHQTILSIDALNLLGDKYGLKLHKYQFSTPTTWMMHQRRYKRPLSGNKGSWYDSSFSKASIILFSLLARINDVVRGNGDAILAEFIKQ